MSLFSEAAFTRVSVYSRDYVKKDIPRRVPAGMQVSDFKDPVSGPYEEHLLPYCKYKDIEDPNCFPEPKEYVAKVIQEDPKIKRYLKDEPYGPPNFDVIDSLYDYDNATMYMTHFCKKGDFDSKTKQKLKVRQLPADWVLPATTHATSYRLPSIMAPEGIANIKVHPPEENLVPDQKERELMGVKTGLTDYQATIGKKGLEFIEGKIHGDPSVRCSFAAEDITKIKLWRRE